VEDGAIDLLYERYHLKRTGPLPWASVPGL
jgi:hypothetical protein